MYLDVLTKKLWKVFAVSSSKQMKIVDDSLKELELLQAALKQSEKGCCRGHQVRKGVYWVLGRTARPWGDKSKVGFHI